MLLSSAATRKSLAVAKYILDRCNEGRATSSVTPMQLLKLVYIAHGWMLGLHGRPLLDEEVQAWQYGPVVPSVYQAVRKYRSLPVQEVEGAPNDFAFDDDEKSVMNRVAKKYGAVNGVALSAATHRPETPWSKTWAAFSRSMPISNDLIEDFYSRLSKQPKHSAL